MKDNQLFYYEVLVNMPKFFGVLTYTSHIRYSAGHRVIVPVGKRERPGIIYRLLEKKPSLDVQLKMIKRVIDEEDPLSPSELGFIEWVSSYYHYPIGVLAFEAIPKCSRLKKGFHVKAFEGEKKDLPRLTNLQQEIIFSIEKDFNVNQFSRHLILGVTGSGKSILYLHLMKSVLEQKKSVQFILPEINLTPQFITLFSQHLGVPVLTYHSGMTSAKKYETYLYLKNTKNPCLLIGVRSSVFLEVNNIGLIVVDEEHDSSLKQDVRCPYHARDLALKKAQLNQIPIVLGSATASLENYYHYQKHSNHQGRHFYLLNERVKTLMPQVELIDMKKEQSLDFYPISDKAIGEIKKRFELQEKVIVYVNKLGFSHYLLCKSCGYQFKNAACGCDNNLRVFKNKNLLSCAYCEYKVPLPKQCPDCGSLDFHHKGFGTEKVKEVLNKVFPSAKIERFDRDEVSSIKKLEELLNRFDQNEIDILVGTQMIAKGHNFKDVNFVLILGVDQLLSQSDFRSQEKFYQMVTQVSGRAGRFDKQGLVYIQTHRPESAIFDYIQQANTIGFYEQELVFREKAYCPPFSNTTALFLSAKSQNYLVEQISKLHFTLKQYKDKNKLDLKLSEPYPSQIEKKASYFTWIIFLRSQDRKALHQTLSYVEHLSIPSDLILKIDVDPIVTT